MAQNIPYQIVTDPLVNSIEQIAKVDCFYISDLKVASCDELKSDA